MYLYLVSVLPLRIQVYEYNYCVYIFGCNFGSLQLYWFLRTTCLYTTGWYTKLWWQLKAWMQHHLKSSRASDGMCIVLHLVKWIYTGHEFGCIVIDHVDKWSLQKTTKDSNIWHILFWPALSLTLMKPTICYRPLLSKMNQYGICFWCCS